MLIFSAVIFSVLRATLPYATGYKTEIQQEISRQIGLPVEIGSIDAAIHWFSPRLKLLNVSILDKNNKLHLFDFKEAFVELDVTASLLRGEIIVGDVGLIGTKISIEKLSDKDWLVQGIKFSREGDSEIPEQFIYMLKNSDYLLHDSEIYYQDHTGEKLTVSLLDVNINVVNSFNTHDIKLSTSLPHEYGENLAIVANLRGDFDSLYGDIYVEANSININQWNKKFKFLKDYQLNSIVDAAVWGVLEGNEVSRLITSFSASNFSIANLATNKTWQTNYLTANMRYLQGGENRQLAISNFYFGEESNAKWNQSVTLLLGENKSNYYFNADFLRLNDLHDIADVIFDSEADADFNKIKAYHLQGDIYNLSLRSAKSKLNNSSSSGLLLAKSEEVISYEVAPQKSLPQVVASQKPDVSQANSLQKESQYVGSRHNEQASKYNFIDGLYLDAIVNNFSMRDEKNNFSVKGIDALVHYENNVGNISLATNDAEVDFNKLFRAPIVADVITGDLVLSLAKNDWEISSEHLQIKNQDINTFTRLNLQSVAKGPIAVDIQTDFYDAYVKHTHKYLPVGIMRKGLVTWLDSAVTNGYVPSGKFILNGDLQDFPYRENNGVFQVLFSVKNLNMKYLEKWPVLTNTTAQLKFHNASLNVEDIKSTTQNALLHRGSVIINNLADPYIKVVTNVRARNTDIQSYIWNSPLDDKLGESMRLFHMDGDSNLNLKIGIPLESKHKAVSVDGRLVFDDAEIYYPEMNYAINQINGVVDFTNDTIFSDSIEAYIEGNPVSISASTHSTGKGKEITFHLDGVVNANYLFNHYDWVPENWFSGSSFWSIDFELPASKGENLLRVNANSLLDNVVINISDEVQKPAGEKIDFNVKIDVMKDNQLTIDAKAKETKKQNAKQINILDFYARHNKNKIWNIDVESEYLSGVIEFAANFNKTSQIKLDLDKVDLSALLVVEGEGKPKKPLSPTDFPALNWKAAKVIWNDWTFSDAVLTTDWNKSGMIINTFVFRSTAFSFDGTGSWLTTSLVPSTAPSSTSSKMIAETFLQGKITSDNLGDALTAFGYERSIDRSDFNSAFNIQWAAEPYALTWDNILGTVSFDMREGEILDVNPGTGGRLLGLMNIFKLTSRLAFDFDDVYRKGFSFDSISGELEFAGGKGSLKKFDVSAPAADINMFGSLGLSKQDYNLLMHVKPHTDTLTFAGGALLGGVAVGAGLALIQKIFDLGVLGHNVYSITGGWDDPVIEEIVEKTLNTNEEDDY